MPVVFAGFLADIRARGTPSVVECLRSENSVELSKGESVAPLNHHRIRREYTPIDSPNYSGVVARSITLVLEAAMASCLEVQRLFGGVPLPLIRPIWAEASVHGSDAINVSARVSDRPDMPSPFLKPGFHHVKRPRKSRQKAQACFFLGSGSNHSRDCCKVLHVSDRRSYTRDVTWEQRREAFAWLLPAARSGYTRHLRPNYRRC